MNERDMRNIERLPSGNFRVCIEHRGERITGTVATYEAAVELRDELKRQIVDGELAPTKGATAKDLGPRFLGSRLGNRDADNESSRWHRHVARGAWARKAVGAVTRADGLAWLKSLRRRQTEPPPNSDPKKRGGRRAETLSWQTRKHCVNLARAFFEWAIDEQLLEVNPFEGLVVEREDGDEDGGYQETWYLDADEQKKLLAIWDTFQDTRRREKWIVAFALGTGLREGEQWCLHLSDVHLDVPEPHIVVRYGSWDRLKKRFRSPKGRKGEKRARVVPLFGLGLEAARAWKAQLSTYAPKNPLGLMFPTERGKLRDKPPRSWPDAVQTFGALPRIGRPIWWHLLRHACASSLVSGWWWMRWSLEDVSKVLGHTDVRTTQIYAHLAPKAVHDTALRAHAAYLGSSHGAPTAQRPAARSPRNDGHARQDSNLRHSASKARRIGLSVAGTAWRGDSVGAFSHVLGLIADGELAATAEIVAWLERGLDHALDAYAEAAGGHARGRSA